ELHAAARSGELEAVESILNSDPLAVNSRDKHSRTPLHFAAWAEQTEVVSYLCNHKANVGAAAINDMGAIHFAAQKGHLEVIRMLVSAGVSVKAANHKGLTLLHYAVQGSHLEVIKYLVKGGSLRAKTKAGKTQLDLASSEEVRSLLDKCKQSSKEGNLNGKEEALKSDPKPSLRDDAGNSGCEPTVVEHNERKDECMKRKGDEEDIREALSEPKKPKVALNHLLSADDTQEEE
ncbi:LOW QUALITY PROTEIN: Ank_2 domain-containing protein, partial [Cephalotus follicularis]